MLAALTLLILGGALLSLPPRVIGLLYETPAPTLAVTPVATQAATPTVTRAATRKPTPTPTFTPSPTATPTVTPTPRPTATAPAIPTATPEVPPPAAALTPLPSAVPAREDARIQLMALALEVDAQGQPVNPGNEFPPGRHRVYAFFQYDGMVDGTTTTFAWYKDGEFIESCSDTWLWGVAKGRDWGEHGFTWYACDPAAGWEPGRYEIRVFIETRLQGIAQFAITEE